MKRFCAFGIAAMFALAICVADANGQCNCSGGTVINAPVVQSAPVANYTYQPAPVSTSWTPASASNCCPQTVVVRPRARRMFTSRRARRVANYCPPAPVSTEACMAAPACVAAPANNCGQCATATVMAAPAPMYTSGCNSCSACNSCSMTQPAAGMSYAVANSGCAGCTSGCGQSMISGSIMSGSGCVSGCGEVSGQMPSAAPQPTPDTSVQPQAQEATPPTPDDT